MTTDNFNRLAADEPPFSEADTQDDNDTKPFAALTLSAPGALPVCHFMRPDGFTVGPVIKGSFAYKRFIAGGWREVQQ